MDILLIIFLTFLLVCLFKLSSRPANFPPGPRGWPLIGYLPKISEDEPVHIALQNLAKVYGPVTGFFLGSVQPFISVNGPKAIKEVLQNDDLNGRPSTAILLSRTYGEKLGILLTDGQFWQEQRRFTFRHLRNLGLGKTSIEVHMIEEIHDMISDISNTSESHPKQIVDFSSVFSVSVINILWAIIGGKRYQRDDLAFKNLLVCVTKFSHSVNSTVQGVLPIPKFLIKVFPSLPKWIGVNMELLTPVRKFVENAIEEHIKNRYEGDETLDFIDSYLNEMDANKNKSFSTFSKKQLVGIVMDLFVAGSETSSSTIGFAILYLIHFQEIQKKIQAELDNVCGESLPSLTNRSSLPYTEAFLMEVMRNFTVAPLSFHCPTRSTKLQGFTIPKGSFLTVNFDSISKDRELWNDPEIFRPERHLDANGNIIKNDSFIPFGMGKRFCLGESLARNTLFLFVTALMKKFDIKPIPDEPLPTLKPNSGYTQGPKPFKAVVSLRNPEY